MKTKLVTIVSVVAVSWLALIFSSTAVGQGESSRMQPQPPPSGTGTSAASRTTQGAAGSIVATPISATEAAKKYPPPKGGSYPMGERDPHKASGIVTSPYPPRQEFDCSKIAHGALVLDTRANKVFLRP